MSLLLYVCILLSTLLVVSNTSSLRLHYNSHHHVQYVRVFELELVTTITLALLSPLVHNCFSSREPAPAPPPSPHIIVEQVVHETNLITHQLSLPSHLITFSPLQCRNCLMQPPVGHTACHLLLYVRTSLPYSAMTSFHLGKAGGSPQYTSHQLTFVLFTPPSLKCPFTPPSLKRLFSPPSPWPPLTPSSTSMPSFSGLVEATGFGRAKCKREAPLVPKIFLDQAFPLSNMLR